MISNHTSLYNISTKPFKEALSSQESVLTVKKTEVESSGSYKCEWKTGDQQDVTAFMEVAVRSKLIWSTFHL